MERTTLVVTYTPMLIPERRGSGICRAQSEGRPVALRLASQNTYIWVSERKPAMKVEEYTTSASTSMAQRLLRFAYDCCQRDPNGWWDGWSFVRYVLGTSNSMLDTRPGRITPEVGDLTKLEPTAYAVESFAGTPLLALTPDRVLYFDSSKRLMLRSPARLLQEFGIRGLRLHKLAL